MSDSEPISENVPADGTEDKSDTKDGEPKLDISPTHSALSPQPSVTHHHITYQPEKDWWDKAKPFVEIGGAVLLAIYTFYTIRMYCANKKSADAAESAAKTADGSLKLTRDSLRATSAGVIVPNIGFQQGAGVVNVVFENRGKGNAWSVSATYRITVVALRGNKPITTLNPKSVVYPIIIPGDGLNDFTILAPYTRHDLDNFNHFGEGVRVEGTVRYNNSFEDVPPRNFCLIAILGNGIPCADLDMRLRANSDPFNLNVPRVPDYYRQKQNQK
jgi:hypothetical protein